MTNIFYLILLPMNLTNNIHSMLDTKLKLGICFISLNESYSLISLLVNVIVIGIFITCYYSYIFKLKLSNLYILTMF